MNTVRKGKGVHMRKIIKEENTLIEMKCDCCGRTLKIENGIVMEGVFSIDYPWGYFSTKDGEIDSLDLCEKCYDRIISENNISITRRDNTELL